MAGRRGAGNLSASDWAEIVARLLRGEQLKTIAHDYGCSAQQIKQITSRSPSRFYDLLDDHGRVSAGLASVDPVLASRFVRTAIRFLATLDATMCQSSSTNLRMLRELRESSDQLMRVVARVRLELTRDVRDLGC